MNDEQVPLRDGADDFRRVVEHTRGAVISTWFAEARDAYLAACRLLALRPPDWERVREATPAAIWLDNLSPAYMDLAHRVEQELYSGDQPSLFDADFESRLARRWSFFAVNLMRDIDVTDLQRLVLQATVGLEGGLDRTAAARAIADALKDRALPTQLWRDPPCI